MKKLILVLTIFGISVLLLMGGYFGAKTIVGPSPSPVPAQRKQSKASAETLAWKDYSSTKAKYSFNYPSTWPLVNHPPSKECTVCVEEIQFTREYNYNSLDNTIGVILIFHEDRIKTLNDYINIHIKDDSNLVDIKETTVGTERAVSYKLAGGIPPLPIKEYVVVKNGFYYQIWLVDSPLTNQNREQNIKLFHQTLKTFKFADEE